MNLKRTATIVVVGGALAAWLAAAMTSDQRDLTSRPAERNAAADARSETLAAEVARLHERLRPTAEPREPARNLFQFTAIRPRPAPPAPKAALTEATPVVPVAPPPPPFKLIGVAEDAGPAGPVRTAIVSGPGQLFLVKEGQNVTLRYRVIKISADVVELQDLGDKTTLRLALK
ncbi:MAG: hypothetical protein DMF91_10840 [Acidobacteria bacterium]|nr:MAG: hypothetical protein DMF91_10840 [Acidobacteriota bacterium]